MMFASGTFGLNALARPELHPPSGFEHLFFFNFHQIQTFR